MITKEKLQKILKKDLEDMIEAAIVAAAKNREDHCKVDVTDIDETIVVPVVGELREGGFAATTEEATEEADSGRTWINIRW